MRPLLALLAALAALCPSTAQAFCGFYVSGADGSLYNDATMVVLMREGRRTVLSMQNNYQGPPEDFALVVPVPVVLSEDNVRTLPVDVFTRVDSLSAPRLVEYWERDPCYKPPQYDYDEYDLMEAAPTSMAVPRSPPRRDYKVTVEAEFAVGEYDIVILSARDSGGLDAWLRDNGYNIPAGAEGVLRPYVASGTKFFVAKVDAKRARFSGSGAVLSPLRVHFDSQEFSLPVRLGLLNSDGEQDLLVHVLARGQRYEAANYDNAFIPTNIRVQDKVRHDFGTFYDALFRKTTAGEPRTVVTEYSWDASSCDPCPTPALSAKEILTLGGDVMGESNPRGWVLTRLHYRYTAEGLDEDLVFRAAPPILGGRGTPNNEGSLQEQQAVVSSYNNQFQGRYVILHWWDGPMRCENPVRGVWGGKEPGVQAAKGRLQGGKVKSDAPLGQLVDEDIPWIGVLRGGSAAPEPPSKPAPLTPVEEDIELIEGRCGTGPIGGGLLALLVALVGWRQRRSGGPTRSQIG
ncbi:MAG: DUF2330 domain-containing protein [Alphaproteobacteria bacterium]|nr:DUF2330 domain-containing protein [Alphaproteobacteria bacterium]